MHFVKIISTPYRHLQFNNLTFIRLLEDFSFIFSNLKLNIFKFADA